MPRRAEMIAVGSELLGPWAVDTNGSYLALRLSEIGIELRYRTVVGDALEDLRDALRLSLGRSELIIVTGGLGPTVDDVTRDAVAAALDLPLVEDLGIAPQIEERFRRHGLAMPAGNRRQALVPTGARVLPNRRGTAPGLRIRTGTSLLILLPGVPSEMRQILEDEVLPGLGEEGERFAYRVLKIAGLTESDVDARLADIQRRAGDVGWTILANRGQIEIHLRERVVAGASPDGLNRLDAEIERVLGVHLFARDEQTMEGVVGGLLRGAGQTLAVAESVTGGAVARRVTSLPGASQYFLGGVVCYSDDAKCRVLGVRQETLAAGTAISAGVAAEMAGGARRLFRSTWGLATTGVAGPEGVSGDAAPGTLFLGISGPARELTDRRLLPGDRRVVRERSALAALDLLRRTLVRVSP